MTTSKRNYTARINNIAKWSEQVTALRENDQDREADALELKIDDKAQEILDLVGQPDGFENPTDVINALGLKEQSGWEWYLGDGGWC